MKKVFLWIATVGLGLYTLYMIVDAIRGRINFNSSAIYAVVTFPVLFLLCGWRLYAAYKKPKEK